MTAPSTSTAAPRPAPPAMRGNKVPRPHRLFLIDGHALRGELYRSPESRLVDHLSSLQGFVSLTKAVCERTGIELGYVAVNLDNLPGVPEVPEVPEVPRGAYR